MPCASHAHHPTQRSTARSQDGTVTFLGEHPALDAFLDEAMYTEPGALTVR